MTAHRLASHSRSATNTVHVLISSLDFGTSLPAGLPPSGSPKPLPNLMSFQDSLLKVFSTSQHLPALRPVQGPQCLTCGCDLPPPGAASSPAGPSSLRRPPLPQPRVPLQERCFTF